MPWCPWPETRSLKPSQTKYLLDFPAAEELKRQLEKSVEHLTFRDIMGLEYRHRKADLIASLEEIITEIWLVKSPKPSSS
jgi:hypothetical protein